MVIEGYWGILGGWMATTFSSLASRRQVVSASHHERGNALVVDRRGRDIFDRLPFSPKFKLGSNTHVVALQGTIAPMTIVERHDNKWRRRPKLVPSFKPPPSADGKLDLNLDAVPTPPSQVLASPHFELCISSEAPMDNSTSVAAEHVEHDAPPCAGRNYYYELVTFKVEDKLYRVPRHGFSQFSIVFESMFSLPQADGTAEGQTDDHPIQLLCASRDFEALLDLLYPQPQIQQREMTKDGWVSVLKLSTQWAMDEARKAAIEKLSEVKLPVLEKVTLAKEYNVAPWLLDGYTDLVQHWGSPSSPSLQDIGTALGWETAARILEVVVKAKGASGAVTTAAFTCPNIHCGIHNSRKYTSGYMPLTLSCAACGTTIVKVTSDDLSTLFESRDRFAEAVRAAFKEELDFMY